MSIREKFGDTYNSTKVFEYNLVAIYENLNQIKNKIIVIRHNSFL